MSFYVWSNPIYHYWSDYSNFDQKKFIFQVCSRKIIILWDTKSTTNILLVTSLPQGTTDIEALNVHSPFHSRNICKRTDDDK